MDFKPCVERRLLPQLIEVKYESIPFFQYKFQNVVRGVAVFTCMKTKAMLKEIQNYVEFWELFRKEKADPGTLVAFVVGV